MIGSSLRRIICSEQGERGQALMVAVMFIVVMAGAAALAIDLGSYISHRRSLQNDADAIALAASLNLPVGSSAQAAANEWAAKNGVAISSMTVTITPQSLPSEPNPKVTIEIEVEHDLTFMRLVGLDTAGLAVTATAIITSPAGGAGTGRRSDARARADLHGRVGDRARPPGQDAVARRPGRPVERHGGAPPLTGC